MALERSLNILHIRVNQRLSIAEAACKHRDKIRKLAQPRPSPDPVGLHARLVNKIVIVAGISISDILAPVLEEMVVDLSTCLAKFTFIDVRGIDFLHHLLVPGRHNDKIPLLASRVLLSLCDEGEWLDDFLDQCARTDSDFWESVSEALTLEHAETLENMAVFIQKISGSS
ncbi:hypothetical protein HDU97_009313 [Phlyctochytrium planicorne]|nr:hypothetical protein HDU97_009313 [Phlyctochytrium planicorne]